jgi:hypothetical protein
VAQGDRRGPLQLSGAGAQALECPLRHESKRSGLVLVLHDDIWAGMVRWDEELPSLAWPDFAMRRTGLDQPVSSRLHRYHTHSGLLMGVALDELCEGLRVRVEAQRTGR